MGALLLFSLTSDGETVEKCVMERTKATETPETEAAFVGRVVMYRFFHSLAIRIGLPLGVLWIVGDTVARVFEALAGKETAASFFVQWTTGTVSGATFSVSIVLTGVGAGWALYERTWRFRKVKALSKRIIELETKIDPMRSSSKLLPDGRTNPDDFF